MRIQSLALAMAMLVASTVAIAQDAEGASDSAASEVQTFMKTLDFQQGKIAVNAAHATLQVDPGYHYLGAADARKVLEQLWGNPPDDSVLGMLVPDAAPLDSDQSWAVVLTYSGEGHVSDDDANQIDYTQMLAEMQQATAGQNSERVKAGYPAMQLVGWAQPPRYDAASHKLHWAKELDSAGAASHYLNYDVRVLGREGFLSMNAVADIRSLSQVNNSMDSVLAMASFDEGHRYADFNASTDRAAGYGLAALIGGGIAAKTGLFAKLGILLLKFWKVAVLGVAAIGAGIAKLLGRGKEAT